MSDDLSLSVIGADGSVTRWGGDEPDAANIPDDLSFSTSMPGGDKDLTCSLLRRIDRDYSDQNLFDRVRVYGPGNRTVWAGRMAQFPRDHGDSYGITPAAVGMSAHLKDDTSVQEIYISRDWSGWTSGSLARQIRQVSVSGETLSGISVDGSAGTGLIWNTPATALADATNSEMFWNAPAGVPAVYFYYQGTRAGAFTNFEDPAIYGSDTEDLSGTVDVLPLTLDDTIRSVVFLATRRYLMLRLRNNPAVTPGATWQQSYSRFAVIGNHGLAHQAVAGDLPGILASDMVANIVHRFAPQLSYSGGQGGSIENTDYPIPHMVFLDPVTPEDAISAINAFHLYDWGCEGDEFFFRQPDPARLTWEARLSDGAKLSLEGDTAEQVYNGVLVSYTDPLGVRKLAGPPGATADVIDASLGDTSATNPVNTHGIPKRWGRLDLSIPTTDAGAVQLGYVWLQERALASYRGQITLTGTVSHPTEGKVPVWRVRAGDWIKIADHPASQPRKIIETSYSHGSRSISLTVGNTAAKVDAILERLGVLAIGRF